MKTIQSRSVLGPGGWALYGAGSTVPLWLFLVDSCLRAGGFGRVISDSLAYSAFAGGAVLAIIVACSARATMPRRMALCGASLLITGLSYVLMVVVSLMRIGPINPG